MKRSSLRLTLAIAVALCLADFSGARVAAADPPAGKADGGKTQEKVIVERLPNGTIRKTTVRTTTRTVEAKSPPPRPADPYPKDPLVRYNVERLNAYRARQKLPPLRYDAKISTFARVGSEQLSRDHVAHAHFAASKQAQIPGFGPHRAENQGDSNGVPVMDANALKNGKAQIDLMLKMMMDEGPGGGHHDNIMNPQLRRIGIGLVYVDGKLYLTNDFSE